MTPVLGFVLVGILLLALYTARRAAKNNAARNSPSRRTRIKSASVRMSARTEMRAMDDAFSGGGPTRRPETRRTKSRAKSTARAPAASAVRAR